MRKKRRVVTSFSVPSDELDVLEAVERIAEREHVSFSDIVRAALCEFISHHAAGNPQTPLFPAQEPWENPMMERRRENLLWLIDTIAANPGVDEVKLAARCSEETGARLETVREWVRTLLMSRAVYRSGGKLYATKRVQPGAEKTES